MTDSRISGFYRMSIDGRLGVLLERGLIDEAMATRLRHAKGGLTRDIADRMIENVIGVFGLPMAVAPNFLINGRDYVAPMVVEEASVVAAVSAAAKLVRDGGGFAVTSSDPVLVGQLHLCNVPDADTVINRLMSDEQQLLALANGLQPRLVARGGGARGMEFRKLVLRDDTQVVVIHLLVDVRDAMGANIVNSMCEGIANEVESIAGTRASLKILSNLADRSLISASASISPDRLGGESIRDDIVLANELALVDPYRAATHNKGIMNGMDAMAIATGNDWRALEAGAHAYAARDGTYRALTTWSVAGNGDLHGELSLPVRMGIVGGSMRANPAALVGLTIAGVGSSQELGELMTAVGLAQNLGALKALVGEGIQKGHMRLHARSVAAAAGVPASLATRIEKAMIESGDIVEWKAKELLTESMSTGLHASGSLRGFGQAAGKVILLGEHAVVYGRPALALPVKNAISASVYESGSGPRLSIPAWNVDQPNSPGSFVADGAMSLLQYVAGKLGIDTDRLHIKVDARIPPAVGLGSSAALAVALIRAISAAFDIKLNDSEINEIAFDCEKRAHGTPSGIDNTLAVYCRPIIFEKDGPDRYRELGLKHEPALVIASSGSRGSTRDQVEGVRNRHQKNPAAYDRIFDEMGRLSLEGANALLVGDFAMLGSLMNVCHGLLNALQVSTPAIEEMIQIARASGAVGAKLTGAGGGGSIVALCPNRQAQVSKALAAAGFEVIGGSDMRGNIDARQ